eukprot:2693707-Lingulodinium_polyedra.AAC.1
MVSARCTQRVRFARRNGGGRSIQPHRRASRCKRYTMMRLRSLSAGATARILRASRTPCRHHFLVSA